MYAISSFFWLVRSAQHSGRRFLIADRALLPPSAHAISWSNLRATCVYEASCLLQKIWTEGCAADGASAVVLRT